MKALLVIISVIGFQFAHAATGSVYTSIKADCVVVSEPTQSAPIDFYEATCKSFGGYGLSIAGSDLRYSPRLTFGATEISLSGPGSFHDMGSDKVEWMYDLTRDEEGAGTLVWKALIYRLNVYNQETQKDDSILYVVRLDGEKSCSIGTAKTNEEARRLALTKIGCQI